MDLGLKGLNVMVTGGTKSIGRRAADMFAAEGANVSICARNAAEVSETVASLKTAGVTAFGQSVDVGDKAALIHYAQGLAHKLAPKQIRVNSVSPGNVYFKGGIWEYIEQNMPDLFQRALSLNLTGRMATAEEVGKSIVFLASPASSFTMGTNLVIDGALTKDVQL